MSSARPKAVPLLRVGAAPPDELLLKVTPPRAQRHLVARTRLLSGSEVLRDHPLMLVQAPAGFGETRCLRSGGANTWRTGRSLPGSWRGQDTPQRLVQALALAVRTSAARPGFGHTLLDARPAAGLEAFTIWLAEVAQTALNVVVFVDEADLTAQVGRGPGVCATQCAAQPACGGGHPHRLPPGHRRPDRIRTMRTGHAGDAAFPLRRDARSGGQALRPPHFDNDDAARLHELTEGWPLGLQLALSAIGSAGDVRVATAVPAAQGSALREHFVALLLANLDAADVAFLTRIAILDHLHADLCLALTLLDDAAERLARMARDTPVLIGAEGSEWQRLRPLARDMLRERFEALPAAEQSDLHGRAADWLAVHGMMKPRRATH